MKKFLLIFIVVHALSPIHAMQSPYNVAKKIIALPTQSTLYRRLRTQYLDDFADETGIHILLAEEIHTHEEISGAVADALKHYQSLEYIKAKRTRAAQAAQWFLESMVAEQQDPTEEIVKIMLPQVCRENRTNSARPSITDFVRY
jgi:hypothetical protein